MSTPSPTPEQQAEFRQMATEMARQIVTAIQGDQKPFVVLEALCMVHRYVSSTLPPELLGHVAFAMAGYAGELMQADAKGMGLNSKPAIH